MNKMKKTQEKNKLLRSRLRSSANKSNISFSPRPQATISSYFSTGIHESDTEATEKTSEDLFKSQTQNKLKNSASTTDDDDDFAQPKTLKLAKIFDIKSTKVPKPKKRQRAPKSVPTFGQDVHVSACSDTNQDHIQLALAMSKSIEEIENPIKDMNKEFESPFPSTQEKIVTVRQTLDQFGFKSGNGNGFSKFKTKLNNIKKKFKYITPTLFLRTDEDRKKIIENNVAAVITNISVYNENNPIQVIPEPINSFLDSKKPNSFLLRNYYNPDCVIYKKSGLDLNEMTENIFYNGTVSPSNVKPGSLLKDWSTIAGRELTPPRNTKIFPKYSPNQKCESSLNNQTSTHNTVSTNINKSQCNELLSCEILPDDINPIITIESSENSTTSISNSLNDICKTNYYQFKINPQLDVSKNKSLDGNVSPDLFSDYDQSDLELNSPKLFTNSSTSTNIPSEILIESPKLFTNSPTHSNALNVAQTCINSPSQIQINSDTSEAESLSLLDISPRRRKNKLLNKLKRNSISDDSDRSLSLLDSVSPRRKQLLKLARNSESKARKNIFDVEKSLASKKCDDNVEHFESFCNNIDDIFDLTQSSNDSTQFNENKFNDSTVIPNIETDKHLNSSKHEIGIDKIIYTQSKSPENKSTDLNIKTLSKTIDIPENSDAESDYLSVTQLLQVYSTEHSQTSIDSSEKAFVLHLSPEASLDLDCVDSSINDGKLSNDLSLNKTAISSSGTESPELSQNNKDTRKKSTSIENESNFDKKISGTLKFKSISRTQSENNLDINPGKILNKSPNIVNKNPEQRSPKSSISISSDEETILVSPKRCEQHLPKISPNEFCYNKIYDDDIDIMSFLGQVNRNEIKTNKSFNKLCNSSNNTILNKSLKNSTKKSFRRSFSESVIGDRELNYISPKTTYTPTKLDHSFTQPHENLYSNFNLTENYTNVSQSFEDIEISDEELNYSVLKSNKNKIKHNSLRLEEHYLLSQSSIDSNSDINDEELNYSSNCLHKTHTHILIDKQKYDLENRAINQTNIFDFNDLPMDICHSPTNDFNSPRNSLNTNPNQSEILKHPRLRDLSTPIALNKFKTLSQPNPLLDDSLNEDLIQIAAQKTPDNHKNIQHIMTPNSNVIIKTTNITPLANYNDMDTPDRNKELEKYGLKPMKRSKGVKILQHIYDATHPISNSTSEKIHQSSSDDEDNRIIKRRKKLSDHFTSQPTCSKPNNISKRKSNQNKSLTAIKIDEKIEIVEQIAESESLNDLIFERTQSSKILSCRLPLHIAWHNLVSSQQDLQEKILLYEPLQVEEIYTKFKGLGYKYHIQDIITFLDKKCITIRVAQNNRKRK